MGYQSEEKVKMYNYTVMFRPLDEGGYDVIVPAIPEICTFGDTIQDARAMAEEAIKCFIESALELNEPIPVDAEVSLEKIAVKVIS